MDVTPAQFLTQARLIAITDREVLGMGDLTSSVQAALSGGLRAVMLREKDLPDDQWLALAREIRALTTRFDAKLLVNRRLHLVQTVGADGVHLGTDGPSIREARAQLGEDILIGYSAHSPAEALTAFDEGADYVFFSPIYATPSKAGILEPTGIGPLKELCAKAPGPVYALGGIDSHNVGEIVGTGAGVAAIRAVFGKADPKEAVETLLAAWDA